MSLADLWDLDKKEISNDDDFEMPKNPKYVIGRGDIWRLGDHRLVCGDAIVIGDVVKLVGEETMDLFLSDPPYNVDYAGCVAGNVKKEREGIKNDDMSESEYEDFLGKSFKNAFEVMKQGKAFYVYHADMWAHIVIQALIKAGFLYKNQIIWLKDQFVIGRRDYHMQHEPMVYGWKPGAAHAYFGGRTKTTVWKYNRPKKSKEHPTMKPIDLLIESVVNSTLPGQNVLDLFGGSGSTLIACEKTGRRAFLMEVDSFYASVIIERWERVTGKRGVKL